MQDEQGHGLKKILGVWFGVAVIIGGTIGVGILRTPGPIAAMLQNEWLILAAWAFGGAYVLIAASSLAELACMLPKAGGAFNYVRAAFGSYAGFVTGWFDYIVNCISPAYFSIVIAEYLGQLFPGLGAYQTWVACALLVLLTLLHLTGLKSGSKTQQVITVIKLVCLLAVVITCLLHEGPPGSAAVSSAAPVGSALLFAFLKSLQLVMGTYDGWGSSVFFAEEDRDPGKNIPRGLLTGIIIIISVYLLMNIALLRVLPVDKIANAPLAAADAGQIIFGDWGFRLITVVALISLLGILNALVMITPRIMFGLSRSGYFVKQAKAVNTGGTPTVALLVSNGIAVVLIIIGSFEKLFALGAFMTMITNSLIFAAVFKLRQSAPEMPRPYRAWGYPFTTAIALLVSLSLFVGFAISDRSNFLFVAVLAGISYPLWRFFGRSAKDY